MSNTAVQRDRIEKWSSGLAGSGQAVGTVSGSNSMAAAGGGSAPVMLSAPQQHRGLVMGLHTWGLRPAPVWALTNLSKCMMQ